MDNYSTSFPATTITTSTTNIAGATVDINFEAQQEMDYSQNLHFPSLTPFYPSQITQGYPTSSHYFLPYDHTIQVQLQIPHENTFHPINQSIAHPMYSTYSMDQNGGALCPMPNWQAYKTTPYQKTQEEKKKQQKMARKIRIQARQGLRISYSNSASSSSSQTRTPDIIESNVENKAIYNFQAPNGKMVKELFKKKLQSSDVNSLGRIIIPKKVAEQNLPRLHDKEGIKILCKDVNSDKEWKLKFKYWSNNKTRMYVLENTRSLVKHYHLQSGDYITLYEDELKNFYLSTSKEDRALVVEPSTSCGEDIYRHILEPYKNKANEEEEEESMALLIEELRNKDKKGLNSLLNF